MNFRALIPPFLREPLPAPVKVVFVPSRSTSVLRDWERKKAQTTDKLRKELGRAD